MPTFAELLIKKILFKMKKTLLLASVSLLAASTFWACNKDKDKDKDGGESSLTQLVISDVVTEFPDMLLRTDSIKLIVWDTDNQTNVVLSSAAYTDGKATLNLPASLDDKFLGKLEGDPKQFAFNRSNMSNPDVKGGGVSLRSSSYGTFYHGTTDKKWRGNLIYINGNLTVTGTATIDDGKYTLKYSIDAKKGWNIFYWQDDDNPAEITTQPPTGAKWIWEY